MGISISFETLHFCALSCTQVLVSYTYAVLIPMQLANFFPDMAPLTPRPS